MFGIHHFGIFLVSSVLFNLTPGPDSLYILGRSLAQGRKAGMASVLGISSGALCHTVAAACGLSALLAASAAAFTVVKWIGAAYLVYLGVRMVLAKGGAGAVPARFASLDFWAIYRQGLFTNLLNPKVVLFFLAFIPQFISPGSSQRFAAFLTLGLCVVTTGTLWCLVLANFSGWLSQKMRRNAGNSQWLNKTVGGLFVYLGVRLAAVRA